MEVRKQEPPFAGSMDEEDDSPKDFGPRRALHLKEAALRTFNKLGGRPHLPEGVAWPTAPGGHPMSFLAQFDLAEMVRFKLAPEMPDHGRLYFFYDTENMVWGFDPENAGHWRVIYSEEPPGAPMSPPTEELWNFQEKQVEFDLFESFRGIFNDNEDFDHQIMGYAQPIQGDDMEEECQLASNGLYCGDSSGYHDPRARELAPGIDDWLLLLQLDSDDDTRMMWSDMGMLYFWIRKQDLAARRFDKVWMILQCF